jgi:hypothetical protein
MEGPVDLRMQPYAPARLFTLEEASTLLPRLTEIFRRMDPKLARLREIQDLVEDAEAYWHTAGDGMPADERSLHDRLVVQVAATRAAVDADVRQIQALGCELKDVQQGLIDFPSTVEGSVAYLCWQRGEDAIGYWHTLESGFAGRRPLKAGP